MRRLRLLLAACGAATLALVLGSGTAAAVGQARLAAAGLVAAQVGHHGLYGPAPDRAMVLGAWRDAGVDIRGLASHAGLLHACQPLDVSAPRPAGPAPGDYALYRDTAGTDRIGMFLSPVDVAVVDRGEVSDVPRPELTDDVGELTVPRLLAQPHSFLACRLAGPRWPGGVDDTWVPAGRIALTDPGYVAAEMAWAAQHPRDADLSVLHTLLRILGTALVGVVGTLEQLITGFFSVLHTVLSWAWPLSAPVLWVGDMLGRSFDGRGLHRVLTIIAVAALALFLLSPFSIPFGWVLVGAVLGGAAASAAGVPVLGAVGGALVGGAFAVASFLVGVVTGVDGNNRVAFGTVVFAIVADLLWIRPMLATVGLVAHAQGAGMVARGLARIEHLPLLRLFSGDGRSALDVSSTLGDALSLRPHAMAHVLQQVRDFGSVAASDSSHVAARALGSAPVHDAVSAGDALATMGRRALDVTSLTWRPSSLSSDLVGHAADALHFLDGEVRTGFPSMPRLRQALAAMDPARRDALLSSLQHTSTHLVPQTQITARLSHLHSGARTLTGLASGRPNNNASWWRLGRSPILRRVLRGLPASGGGPAA